MKEEDGGEYTCTAQNIIGKYVRLRPEEISKLDFILKMCFQFFRCRIAHSAKVNIYGLPFIREMPKITGISGTDLIIKCPVAGYPIDKVQWERGEYTILYKCFRHDSFDRFIVHYSER